MNDGPINDSGLDRAVAGVYGGPLEEFVRRRDGLAKELRAAGQRAAATYVKGLRKPSRLAWALDVAAVQNPDSVQAVHAAVTGTLEAQAAGGDVRGAIARLRSAVRDFAGLAAHAAAGSGARVDAGVLANAVLAVLGRPDDFAQLCRGALADIPDAGGLDFLTSLPAPSGQAPPPAPPRPPPATATPTVTQQREEEAAAAAAHEAARQAVQERDAAREAASASQRALDDAMSRVRTAEARLQDAQHEVERAHAECEHARMAAETAARQVQEAERAAAAAERHLADVLRSRS